MTNTLTQANSFSQSLKTYTPILMIVATVTLISGIICVRHGLNFAGWMNCWMAGLLIIFALFKLFDVPAFAKDFTKYDILAQKLPGYALAYPFIELGLGAALVAGIVPLLTQTLILLVFGIGFFGVLQSVRRGENLQCACVGRMFNLPLSRVALFEDATMVLMSGAMLIAILVS